MYFDELDLNDNVLDALYDMTPAPLYKRNVSLRYWQATTYLALPRLEPARPQRTCCLY